MRRVDPHITLIALALAATTPACQEPSEALALTSPPLKVFVRPADIDTCPTGSACRPLSLDALPASVEGDTRRSISAMNAYSCAPHVDQSGGEVVYRINVPRKALLKASIDDAFGDKADLDLHLLQAPDPGTCLTRGDLALRWVVQPGTYFLSVDTTVDSARRALSGPFKLSITLDEAPASDCAVQQVDLRMNWSSCDAGLDCFVSHEKGKAEVFLRTPARGPMVLEAHLMTDQDDLNGYWPSNGRHGIQTHHALSEAATGYVMQRKQPWAPAGEGGCEFGQGSAVHAVPVLAEAWYVTMHWRDRPAQGTRMIITNPANGRAVVAAGGYETGPASNTAVGGASEEIHHHLGTTHRDPLIIGFAVDQSLPYGPIDCPQR